MELAEKFCQIVETEHNRMVSIMRRKIKSNPDLAEDMMQQAYLHIWKHISHSTLPVAAMTAGFVLNNAVQRYIDYTRAKGNRPTTGLDEVEIKWGSTGDGRLGPEAEVVERLEQQDRRALLYQCVEAMTPAYRAVMLLRLRGWEYKRIAEYLHVPLGTVKGRINYATGRLIAHEAIVSKRQPA